MTTRLDRLVSLLDTGSTPAIRATAAKQLGQIAGLRIRGQSTASSSSSATNQSSSASSHPKSSVPDSIYDTGASTPASDHYDPRPHEAEPKFRPDSKKDYADLNSSSSEDKNLYRGTDGDWDEIASYLARVVPYLRSKSWDTRVAASVAVEAICHAAGIWDPDLDVPKVGESSRSILHEDVDDKKDAAAEGPNASSGGLLSFQSFSLPSVLSTGTKLLSSAGKEYDTAILAGPERLAQAKKDVASKLGLGFGGIDDMDLGMDVEAELKTGEEVAASANGNSDQKSSFTAAFGAPPRLGAAGLPSLPPPRFGPKAPGAGSGGPSGPPITAGTPPAQASHPSPTSSSPGPLAEAAAAEEIDMSKLSARERNQLKRKRKMEGKGGAAAPSTESKTRVVEHADVPPSPSASIAGGSMRIKTPSGTAPVTPATPAGVGSGGTTDYISLGGSHAPRHPAGVAGSNLLDPSAVSTPAPLPELADSPGAAIAGGGSAAPRVTNSNVFQVVPGEWPFRLVAEVLSVDLFSPMWETRHGAALGLRELFKTQGSGGGKVQLASKEANEKAHKQWCDDIAIKLLCVFALDRLGDFVFDQVVAPVRETASQTLACLMPHMPISSIMEVHQVLLQMIRQDHVLADADAGDAGDVKAGFAAKRGKKGYVWEVRHAGLLGLKYEVVVKKDLLVEGLSCASAEASSLPVKKEEGEDRQSDLPPLSSTRDMLKQVVEVSVMGLRDEDDDVRAVAAATLLPIADMLVSKLPSEVGTILDQLWDCLGDLKDDLSSSIGGVMDLLAKLVEHPNIIEHLSIGKDERSLSALIPRLYPFFRHTITNVRLSVLNTLKVFLTVPSLPRDWVDERVLRLLFQNLVVEERIPIRKASSEAWSHALSFVAQDPQRLRSFIGPYMPNFFKIIMTPLGSPIDFSLFYSSGFGGAESNNRHNVDKGILAQDLALVGVDAVIRGRLGAAEALGAAMARWPKGDDEDAFGNLLMEYLESTSALQKCLTATIIQEWAEATTGEQDVKDAGKIAIKVSGKLNSLLEAPPPPTYAEMAVLLQRIQGECQGLYNSFARDAKLAKAKIPALPTTVDPLGHLVDAFTIETAKQVAKEGFDSLLVQVGSKAKKAALPLLEDRQRKLIAAIGFYQATKEKQDTQVYASVAGAVISLKALPPKLNPVIRSVMNSVKFEENADLQMRSAKSVARLIAFCTSPAAKANPSDKIVKNLCAFVCQDTTQVPIFSAAKGAREGILSLVDPPPRSSGRGAGKEEMVESEDVLRGRLIRRGAERALAELSSHFKADLFKTVPMLWECMSAALRDVFSSSVAEGDHRIAKADECGQSVLDACAVLQVNMPNLDAHLNDHVLSMLSLLTKAIQSEYAVIRSAAAKCFSSVANCLTEVALRHVVEHVVPLVGDATSVINRQGAVELIYHVVGLLDLKILPYVIFLVVPILGRMSDVDQKVRLMATNTFASLVKMVPLEAGLPDPPGFPAELLERRQSERKFLTQLLDGSKVEPYEIPIKLNAELRKYQRDGVSWMAFLAKYQLHGILCDDMGLGKTLQSISILSSKHHERLEKFRATGSPDAKHMPSLIVCPPTLTGHWVHEIKQYANNIRPLLYSGLPVERVKLQSQIPKYDAVVMSYDVVRNDIAALSRFNWFYCILDEGHVIRSAKTKTTKAVKMIRADHRLILSGTPIQNNVLELWSLFDFLMPGFLGTERSFHERFGKPIIASRDGKLSSREQEAAALALEALHKQVLPFLLRRLKEDVLDDLPPKIIQDIECDLSDVQKQLYDDFSRSQESENVEGIFSGSGGSNGASEEKQHVFKALQYMRKLVNHPALILKDDNPKHTEILRRMEKNGGSLHDIANAPKLQALRQLLYDCGIGNPSSGAGGESEALTAPESAISQHRVLIFCQLKQMMDIIETDLFKALMPSVSYMRLDGSVSTDKRHGIVQTFNSDPSIDVLLLTTQVGGLGLTLTGADTVIFVEHDWNPMKDLQAMDRAHRLGQKKVVNVYRLITRNTLEAKIMGLQRFKLNIANSVVNQQNSGVESMETDQILDLFGPNDSGAATGGGGKDKSAGGKLSQKALLESLENMPETEEAEYSALSQWRP
ncbi:hypothetical protein IE53DRAFT_31699 [Violaceomyces palustris]|uniref:Uncharacterized protein n=1 Tax=Violaceomyces palustris TaxID=1673888 RepID=A0ACD0P1H9_9BASI|nr:hypothetical protein IE53DRAFT_31699 [Violaceomyces palustris]